MGKWTYLKGTLPSPPEDAGFREQVNLYKETVKEAPLEDLLHARDAMEDIVDAIDVQLKAERAKLEAFERVIIERMELTNEAFIRFEGNGTIGLQDTPVIEVTEPGKFRLWIEKHAPELLTVYAATRDSITKTRLEAGEKLPDGIKVTAMRTTLSRRGRAGKPTKQSS